MSGWYGLPGLAEHWSCGGSAFPRTAGAIVHLSGILEGTYQVQGVAAVLDISVHDASDIPRGYDLVFQTCLGNNSHTMAFVGLTRIG